MTKEQVSQWMDLGLEIQFEYGGKGYYMSPIWDKSKAKVGIFFCEDYQSDAVEAKDVDELWESAYRGSSVGAILDSVPEDQVDGLI